MRADRPSRGLFRVALVAAAVLAGSIGRAPAAEGAEETLKTLYRIALSAEMCGFPIAPRQSEALGKSMNRALTESGLDPDAADELYRDVDASLEAEGWDKVCAAGGDWARNYRALLAANTK